MEFPGIPMSDKVLPSLPPGFPKPRSLTAFHSAAIAIEKHFVSAFMLRHLALLDISNPVLRKSFKGRQNCPVLHP